MKNIIEFLKKNGIEYQEVTYGNPYYYNDVFNVLDFKKQQEHEERIQKDIEKFLTRRTRM